MKIPLNPPLVKGDLNRTFLSVVIPAYNESKRIRDSLKGIINYLEHQKYIWEIIIVNDGSSDSTADVIRNLMDTYPVKLLTNETNRGKGFSVRKGMLNSQGEYVLFSDADLSTPIDELSKMLKIMAEGYDLVIGSRGLKESKILIRQPFYREFMGKVFNRIVRLLTVRGINDTQCGFKLFRGDIAKRIFNKQRLDGFSFDVEILYIAKKCRFSIKEIPVRWTNSPDSKVRALKNSPGMFFDLIKINFYNITGNYNNV